MKTWKRALALVLALVMALSLVALPSFAAGEETGANNGSTRIEYEGESGKNKARAGRTTAAWSCPRPSRKARGTTSSC